MKRNWYVLSYVVLIIWDWDGVESVVRWVLQKVNWLLEVNSLKSVGGVAIIGKSEVRLHCTQYIVYRRTIV